MPGTKAFEQRNAEDRGLFAELVGDGRPLLALTAYALLLSGGFAVFLSLRREFLPHDVAYLGMTADELCRIADCRVVRFMFHDRVSFGGTLIAIAALYLWLQAFPLRQRAAWAWWAFAISGGLGFGSFLSYLGFGYLDVWHGTATLALLPTFIAGLILTRRLAGEKMTGWLRSAEGRAASVPARLGRWGLIATGVGLALAGAVISFLGMTEVFVAEDLAFMEVTRAALDEANPRLVPLIAHDRAGFGGGVLTVGILLVICGWYARPSRAFYQAALIAGLSGFGCGIVTHFYEGYLNLIHLAPAFSGAALFAASVAIEMRAAAPALRTSPSP